MKRPLHSTNYYDINENMVVDDFDSWCDILRNRRISPQMLQLISKFSVGQVTEVRLGIEHGLTEKCIRVYVEPKLPFWRMEQVRLGFEDGLTLTQVQLYLHLTDADAMKQVRLGIKNGLSQDQLDELIKTTPDMMQDIRERFEYENAVNCIKNLISSYK